MSRLYKQDPNNSQKQVSRYHRPPYHLQPAGEEYYLELAKGNVKHTSYINKFGRNFDIDTGTVPEDIWAFGGLYPFPTSSVSMTLSSEDSTDTSDGVGARTVCVEGLDSNYDEYKVDLTLNGQNAVSIPEDLIRVHRVRVNTAGTSGSNQGNLHVGYGAVGSGIPAVTLGYVRAGENQTLQAIYTIPNNKTGYLTDWEASMLRAGNNKSADIELYFRQSGSVFQIKDHIGLTTAGTSFVKNSYTVPQVIPQKTDVVIRTDVVGADDTDVAGAFNLILVDNRNLRYPPKEGDIVGGV